MLFSIRSCLALLLRDAIHRGSAVSGSAAIHNSRLSILLLKKMKTIHYILALCMVFGITLNSCKKDKISVENPPYENPEELITTVTLTFIDSANTLNRSSATFKDTDGAGGNAPSVFDTIRLMPDRLYLTSILLLNESNPGRVDTISNEVLEEADEHQFFFHVSGTAIKIDYRDKDKNNLPLGLSTAWKTTSTGKGTCRLILKHQSDVKNGTESPGETDVELIFQTRVQ